MEYKIFNLISIILLISVYEISPSHYPIVRSFRKRCSTLPTVKNASLRCKMNGFQKCYAKCLAGHVLQHHYHRSKVALTCRNGDWWPQPNNLKCVVSNTCKIKLVKPGEVVCKATSDSYQCHITCISGKRMNAYLKTSSTYVCNAEKRSWSPNLPKCAKQKSYYPIIRTKEKNWHYPGRIVRYHPRGNGHRLPPRMGPLPRGGNGRYQPGRRIVYVQPGGNGRYQPGRRIVYVQPGGSGRCHSGRIGCYPSRYIKKGIIKPQKKGANIKHKKFPRIVQVRSKKSV